MSTPLPPLAYEQIRKIAAAAPPLSEWQRTQIAALLAPYVPRDSQPAAA